MRHVVILLPQVPNVIVELYTLSSLDTFTKIESPPTSVRLYLLTK